MSDERSEPPKLPVTTQTLAGLDPKLAESVAAALRDLPILNVDFAKVSEAAKGVETIHLTVAPQIADVFRNMEMTNAFSFTEAAKTLRDSSLFNFATTFDDLDATKIRSIAMTMDTSEMFPTNLMREVTAVLGDYPWIRTADAASEFDKLTEDAAALAEVETLAEALDDSVGFAPKLAALSPAQRRALAIDVVLLLAAYLILASWILHSMDQMQDPGRGAGAFLVTAATYIRVYWRLIGKLD
ncbi:MAG: hypothetical protein M3P18_07070 [Actinomycetota bacterium]|nr:hypothetical protein [Actinomycetota bacterium]